MSSFLVSNGFSLIQLSDVGMLSMLFSTFALEQCTIAPLIWEPLLIPVPEACLFQGALFKRDLM